LEETHLEKSKTEAIMKHSGLLQLLRTWSSHGLWYPEWAKRLICPHPKWSSTSQFCLVPTLCFHTFCQGYYTHWHVSTGCL